MLRKKCQSDFRGKQLKNRYNSSLCQTHIPHQDVLQNSFNSSYFQQICVSNVWSCVYMSQGKKMIRMERNWTYLRSSPAWIYCIHSNEPFNISSCNLLPKEELWFWPNSLNSNLNCLFVINVKNCFSTKMKEFSEISFFCVVYSTSFSNTGESPWRFNPGTCFIEIAKQTCEVINLWKLWSHATLLLERLLSVPSESPHGHFLQRAFPEPPGHIAPLNPCSLSTVCFVFRYLSQLN